MSDQNRDTSRPYQTNKNPLLSASVTGLTFDDFTNKAIILPAAALPPKLPEPKDIKDTEPTRPVIFGNVRAILDTETFSEISLDQPSDVETYPPPPNPLQDDTEYSKTFNPLTQATHLTASLSQLPSVASSVFSSFSNILRGNSPTPVTSNDQQPQIDSYNVLPAQPLADVPLINSSLSYQSEESREPAVAPTFYSTNDPAFLPPAPTLSPPPPINASSGNAYRLTTKRKTYAPAPGLSHQDNQTVPTSGFPAHVPHTSSLSQPTVEPHFQVNQSTAYRNTAINQPTSQNKFSLTSFFSTPLLEKITGSSVSHAQEAPSAAQPDLYTIESTNPPASVNFINPGLFNTNPVTGNTQTSFLTEQQPSQPSSLYFNPSQQANPDTANQVNPTEQQPFHPTPPLATPLFFNPGQQVHSVTTYQHNPVQQESLHPTQPSAAPLLFNPGQQVQSVTENQVNPAEQESLHPTPPLAAPLFFNSTQQTNLVATNQVNSTEQQPIQPTSSLSTPLFFNPGQQTNLVSANQTDNTEHPALQPTPPLSTPLFFNPDQQTKLAAASKTDSKEQQVLHPAPSLTTPLFFNPDQQTDYTQQPPPQPTPPLSTPLFFNPGQTHSSFETIPKNPSIPLSSIPPTGQSSGNVVSNYRLRGKPHYKNPLSSTTTSTAPLVVPFPQATPTPTPSVGLFNPVNPDVNSNQHVPTISSTITSAQSIDSTGLQPQTLSPATTFFNQQQRVSVDSLFNPFDSNNSGNNQSEFPITNSNPFGRESQTQPGLPVPQSDQAKQSVPVQHQIQSLGQVHFQPVQPPVEETQQFQVQRPDQIYHTGQLEQQQSETETNQLQQLSQQQHLGRIEKEIQQVASELQPVVEPSGGDLQATPLQLSSNPFAIPTSDYHNIEDQNSHQSNIFTPLQQPSNLYSTQTTSTGSAEFNQYLQEESPNTSTEFNYREEVLDKSQSQFTNLNKPEERDFNWEQQSRVEATKFFDLTTSFFDLANSQQDNVVNSNQQKVADTENSNPTTFDNFFNQQSQSKQSENLNYPDPPPATTSTLASSFFSTSPNSSDWFNSPRTVEPSTNQIEGDINRNTEVIDASNFFAANNRQNQTNSSRPNYFQIQNFFNNPPLIQQSTVSKEQDSNFNFIEDNLINKRLHNLTQKASTETDGGSVSSNIVEPPSSAQSEFSEFAEINPETAQSDEYIGEQQFSVDSLNTANMANTTDQSNPAATEISNVVYRPVYKHWFYNKTASDQKPTWTPFPMNDSLNLEEAYASNSHQFITTNGGRYDVNIENRTRSPIYWNGASDEVRRCSWFYKGADSRLVPYDEGVSDLLEEEYRTASQSGEWNRKITIPSGEVVMFQAPSVIVHFLAAQTPDLWPNATIPQTANRPRVVKRGVDEFNIEDGEPEQINHLLFMVHGIGAGCDLKFRSVEEVVEDFRAIALQLTQSHYRSSCDRGEVGRIEILPVSWHVELHSVESGIDEKLKAITLESIPKLRTFTNDTLLDILFYSSPVFCQKIMDTVAGTINKMYIKYCERNPNFKGNVSLAGHSLGSLILFDLLQNQRVAQCSDSKMDVDCPSSSEASEEVSGVRTHKPLSRTRSRKINYTIGTAGTGQPFINYPQLVFSPKKFFALGSPIGMFVTIRGVDTLGLNYKLPTTDGFYNIFHPYDPVAYRIEALVNSELIPLRPVLIPHHKGRKRMHLELRETMARVGADIKQKIIDTFKSVYNFASLQKNDPKTLQQEVDKVLEQQLALESPETERTRACSTSTTSSDTDNGDTEFSLGILNEGKRIDYVLQEAPLEFFNEYLFALTSHVCYWDSADTILFIVKEIYTSLGMQTDSQIPQQSMTIERPISTTTPTPTDS